MIEKLNKEQQALVSGGNSYCKFTDGTVLVCITGDISQYLLYGSWGEALQAHRSIGSFTPRKPDGFLHQIRDDIEQNINRTYY